MRRATAGVTLFVDTLRITEVRGALVGDVADLGEAILRRNVQVTMTPVINAGKKTDFHYDCGCVRESYKAPDTFARFEFELQRRWRLRWGWLPSRPLRDRDLERILAGHCAVEFWTVNHDGKVRNGWIHWLYPSTSWLRVGRAHWTGKSHDDGPQIKPEDFPDQTLSLSHGGFWKTLAPPPA